MPGRIPSGHNVTSQTHGSDRYGVSYSLWSCSYPSVSFSFSLATFLPVAPVGLISHAGKSLPNDLSTGLCRPCDRAPSLVSEKHSHVFKIGQFRSVVRRL